MTMTITVVNDFVYVFIFSKHLAKNEVKEKQITASHKNYEIAY